MNVLFIMDPIEGFNRETDTTYPLMREAAQRGHRVYYTLLQGLHVKDDRVFAHARNVSFHEGERWYEIIEEVDLALDHLDVIFQRKDPPFDEMYLNSTHLLEQVADKVFILNHPRGLREANEKLYALNFPDCTPPTEVSAHADDIHRFLESNGGKAVIKRLDRSGGSGVFLLDKNDRNHRGLIEAVTEEGRRYALVQAYLPEVVDGDKRIIVLDGEPVGSVLRRPRADDLRGNIHIGATTHVRDITAREREICARLAPRLREDGLWFVGLDFIGATLTEINVTSPTGFQEIRRLTGQRLEVTFLDFVEAKSEQLKAG